MSDDLPAIRELDSTVMVRRKLVKWRDWIAPLKAVFSATAAGLVPASGGGTAKFLRADGGWAVPPGGGSVPTKVSELENDTGFVTGVGVVGDSATSDPVYLVWTNGTGSAKTSFSISGLGRLAFTPSTGTLAALRFEGDGSGLTDLQPAWGAITGTLAAQTDLAAALAGKETAGAAAAAVTAHEAASDPHPQYLTPAEGNAAYAAISHGHAAGAISGLATVAITGAYGDLAGLPTIPTNDFVAYAMTQSLYTLANTGAYQRIFNVGANGALTVDAGTYWVRMLLFVGGMSTSSGNAAIDIKGAGTAAIASGRATMSVLGVDSSTPGTAAARSGTFTQSTIQMAAPVVSAASGVGLAVVIEAAFDIGTAGTLIPSIALTTPVGTAFVAAGSCIEVRRLGPTATASVGAWS